MVNQINEQYKANCMTMRAYLERAKVLLSKYKKATVQMIFHSKNIYADALARLASTKDTDMLLVYILNPNHLMIILDSNYSNLSMSYYQQSIAEELKFITNHIGS